MEKKAIIFSGLDNVGRCYRFVCVVKIDDVSKTIEKVFSENTEVVSYEVVSVIEK